MSLLSAVYRNLFLIGNCHECRNRRSNNIIRWHENCIYFSTQEAFGNLLYIIDTVYGQFNDIDA
mgnify:CR=1 FL=1